jgi:hypothetical protein
VAVTSFTVAVRRFQFLEITTLIPQAVPASCMTIGMLAPPASSDARSWFSGPKKSCLNAVSKLIMA